MKIRFMSYNIQTCHDFYSREINVPGIAEVIRRMNADVIGLNEVRDEGPAEDYFSMAGQLAEELNMQFYFARAVTFKSGPYGNAILSRYPLSGLETHAIENAPKETCTRYFEPRCVLKAHLDAGRGADILVSHFGLNVSEQELAVKKVLELKDRLAGPVVMMGDLNAQPHDAVLQPLFEAFSDTAAAAQEKLLTFPSDHPSIKIDYIFLSGGLSAEHVEVPPIIASDHLPYIADITL